MNFSLEQMILVCVYLISIVAFLYLQHKKTIETHTVFLFHQLLTWIFGILVVECGLVLYPAREFQVATHTSFVYEFLAFPVVACYFNVFFPEKGTASQKIMYYLVYTSALTIPEIILEKYTLLIKYIYWTWYWTFFTVWITFYVSHMFYRWFFAYKAKGIV